MCTLLHFSIDDGKALESAKVIPHRPRLLDSKRDVLSGADGKQDWLLRRRTAPNIELFVQLTVAAVDRCHHV